MTWLERRPDGDPDLDADYLGRLEGLVGSACFRELLSDGLFDITDLLGRLEEHHRAGNRRGVAETARQLSAAAGLLGLVRLSLEAAAVEQTATRTGAGLGLPLRTLAGVARPGIARLAERVGARR